MRVQESISCDLSPDQLGGYAASYSSSISEDNQEVVQLQASPDISVGESTLEWLLREERLFNERRRLLYCTKTSLSKLVASFDVCDIVRTSLKIIHTKYTENLGRSRYFSKIPDRTSKCRKLSRS